MKKQFSKLITLFFCLLVFATANATIISGSHTTTGGKTVALQGLEWLSLDHTQQMSRDQVENAGGWTDRYGTSWNAGDWRYASRAETETLINSLWGGNWDGWSNDNHDGASWFIDIFEGLGFDSGSGYTRTDGTSSSRGWTNYDYSSFYFGDDGDCHSLSSHTCVGNVRSADNYQQDINGAYINGAYGTSYSANTGVMGSIKDTGGANMGINPANSMNVKTDASSHIGSLLVRNSTVPEPSSLVILSLGLLGLRFQRRRRTGFQVDTTNR